MRRGILTDRDELTALRSRITRRPYDAFYEALVRRCALILESAPVTEMNWQAAWANGRQNAALTAARGIQGRILDLVVADCTDRNSAYRSRAVEELKNLLHWTTWVDPSRPDLKVDLCTAEAAVACLLGLDLLWDSLDEPTRELGLKLLRTRVLEPYLESVGEDVWWYTAVNHWNAVINSACSLVGLALSDETDAADQVDALARTSLRYFFDDLGREGGWDEGIGFWGFALRYVCLLGRARDRLLDDQSIFHQRGMDATSLFPIYFSPNGHPASFGDVSQLPLHGTLYLLDHYSGRNELTWWLDTYHAATQHDPSTMEWSTAGLALLCRKEGGELPSEPELEPVKVYHQIGWAAMADQWPRPALYVSMKTGDLAASHAQHDMNSIQVQADGEMLLVDLGHPTDPGSTYFSVARSGFYEVQARSHNTLIVAEEDHRPDAQGSIEQTQVGKDYRWVLGDAHDACGESVRFLRHVVMLTDAKGQGTALVVLDELNLGTPERVDEFWHTAGKIELADGAATGRIVGRRAALDFAFAASAPIHVTQERQRIETRHVDQYLRVHGSLVGPGRLVSVFSREAITTPPQMEARPKDGLAITTQGCVLEFVAGRGRLVLQKVTRP